VSDAPRRSPLKLICEGNKAYDSTAVGLGAAMIEKLEWGFVVASENMPLEANDAEQMQNLVKALLAQCEPTTNTVAKALVSETQRPS
jgi:hypothetical protein